MPNGKPGDHPITDIILHKMDVFSRSIDALIAEIVSLGGLRELESKYNLFRPPPLDAFETELRAMRDHLQQEAKERGWEVD